MAARDRFEQTRTAVNELRAIRAMIAAGGRDWMPEGVRSNSLGDPTANQAIYNLETLEGRLAYLMAREAELCGFIRTSLRLIQAVRKEFGELYGSVLRQRYVDGLQWRDVRYDGKKVARSTGKALVSKACAWIDEIGTAEVLERWK